MIMEYIKFYQLDKSLLILKPIFENDDHDELVNVLADPDLKLQFDSLDRHNLITMAISKKCYSLKFIIV